MAQQTNISREDLKKFVLAILPKHADFTVAANGSIFILTPLSPAADTWVDEFLSSDAIRWAGGIVVEHRFISDILRAIKDAGLLIPLNQRFLTCVWLT